MSSSNPTPKQQAKTPPPTGPPPRALLSQCDWKDKTLWVARQLLGGQSVNGFLKSTATVQRIKKQRARQAGQKREAATTTADDDDEDLKKQIMNARTTKKLKTEMEAGVDFCVLMHETIESILKDLGVKTPPSLDGAPPPLAPPPPAPAEPTTVSAGDPTGSTLRKQRKKKLPPCTEELPTVTGKTKKEQHTRFFEALRFRALRPGDFVAARPSSRDLWILATVTHEAPAMPHFWSLSQAKRDRETVGIKDVEEADHPNGSTVPRQAVLPLPRSPSEASAWCQRLKKGYRVYAMYPNTTSLYSATVVDSNTFCRDDDDIVVVEFDGDEADATGSLPKCHIPARFVVLLPSEFESEQAGGGATNLVSTAALDSLNLDDMGGLEGFEDLDFDLGLGDL